MDFVFGFGVNDKFYKICISFLDGNKTLDTNFINKLNLYTQTSHIKNVC